MGRHFPVSCKTDAALKALSRRKEGGRERWRRRTLIRPWKKARLVGHSQQRTDYVRSSVCSAVQPAAGCKSHGLLPCCLSACLSVYYAPPPLRPPSVRPHPPSGHASPPHRRPCVQLTKSSHVPLLRSESFTRFSLICKSQKSTKTSFWKSSPGIS